ncbi:MAG TPA: efflux RND transporter periplasmic adaptor subunit [Xanthomonadales bacterium]|nr:efflux RND transporter periplasmic adaptor subunit [Xanthomonadales bacterium]
MTRPSLDELRIDRQADRPASRAGLYVLLAILAVAALAVLAYRFWPAAPVEVRTVVARKAQDGSSAGSAATVLNASGYVTARRQATVSAKFTGRVTEVLIEEGMVVEEGQVLARLDDSNLQPALALAEAQRLSAQRGESETAALLTEAKLSLERSQRLVEKKLTSQAELDRARALAESLEAQLARKQADVEVAARQVDISRQQVEDSIIRAPFAGVVVAKNAQPGEMISPISAGGGFTRTGIGTIVDMASLEIEIDVNEAYINRVEPGQAVVATLDAYPDWKIPCHVIAIIPTADRQRATVEVRVGFDELDPRILPDMGVKVAFQESEAETQRSPAAGGLTLPREAVRREQGRDYVLVVRDGKVERRAVATGAANDVSVTVISGLAPGESVVIEGPGDLLDGTAVKEK